MRYEMQPSLATSGAPGKDNIFELKSTASLGL